MSILNLAGQQLDIVVIAGDSVTINLALEHSDGNEITLAGYTMSAQVRPKHGAEPPVNFEVTTEEDGAIYLHIPPGETTDLPPYNVWDFQVTSQDQKEVRTLVAGAFRVKSEVTR